MIDLEMIFTNSGEASESEIAVQKIMEPAKFNGASATNPHRDLEEKSRCKVVSFSNFLNPIIEK